MHRLITGILAGALAAACPAAAQFDLQLPLQYGYQQTIANPAALQDHHVTVALPSVGVGYLTPVATADIGRTENGTLVLDADQAINRLATRGNDARVAAIAETIAFNYRRAGWQAGVSHRVRGGGAVDLPRGLIQLAAYGNARYAGTSLEVMPAVHASAFQEFAAHGAFTFRDRLTFGARAKLLLGSFAVATSSADATLTTDHEFYAATILTNAAFSTAGVPVSFDGTGIDVGDPRGLSGAGLGFGFDFGAIYRQGDALELGFSLRDLGGIRWSGDAMEHRSAGTFTFRGYEGDIFEEEGFEFDAGALVDSLVEAVAFRSTPQTFRTALPATLQATARYRLSARTSALATAYAANQDRWHSAFGIGLNQAIGQWFNGGLLAGMKSGGAYLGANVLFDLWGPQLYVACDNVLALTDLDNANDAWVRAGINLAFGQVRQTRAVKGWYDVQVEGINK